MCDSRTISPNPKINPNRNPNPNRGTIFLGGICPDTLIFAYLKK